MKYLVLGLNPWEMTDEKSGLVNSGVSVFYLDNQPIINPNGKVGYFPIKVTAPSQFKDKLNKAPAYYDIDFGMRPDSKGKAVIFIHDINFVSVVDMPLQVKKVS